MRVPVATSIVLAMALSFPAPAAEKPAGAPGPKAAVTTTRAAKAPAAPAMTIHVDPVTGELVPAPATEVRDAAAPVPDLPPLATQESPVPGGGQMVVLDDRFMLQMSATVAPGGEVRHVCRTEEAKPRGKAKKADPAKAARPSKDVRRER